MNEDTSTPPAHTKPPARLIFGPVHEGHTGGTAMTTFIAGGTGFIGRRLVPLLAQRGEEIVCMDVNPQTADFGQLGNQVKVVRGDVSQFDDVMAAMTAAKPQRVINLAYWIGS
jgi:nucleoside-diphosphate-sugar epimerase